MHFVPNYLAFNPVTGVVSPFGNSVTGSNIQLTVSSDMSAAALQALNGKKVRFLYITIKPEKYYVWSVVLHLTPLNIPSDIETNSAYEGVYLNNALSSTYTPGSILRLLLRLQRLKLFRI